MVDHCRIASLCLLLALGVPGELRAQDVAAKRVAYDAANAAAWAEMGTEVGAVVKRLEGDVAAAEVVIEESESEVEQLKQASGIPRDRKLRRQYYRELVGKQRELDILRVRLNHLRDNGGDAEEIARLEQKREELEAPFNQLGESHRDIGRAQHKLHNQRTMHQLMRKRLGELSELRDTLCPENTGSEADSCQLPAPK